MNAFMLGFRTSCAKAELYNAICLIGLSKLDGVIFAAGTTCLKRNPDELGLIVLLDRFCSEKSRELCLANSAENFVSRFPEGRPLIQKSPEPSAVSDYRLFKVMA